ncbi:uncharacterized protein LOC114288176 [Camellia sinensis]|uniref:uncharacterized protein LOC114288176 n=1 Tax=Camellia sinensis TaxID=4442 RepID=UPI0010356E1B|nr:uncharacterized protein LOC114288176 [Camellia sinensis]
MHTLYGSSDEREMDDRFAEFKEDVDMVKLELKVGMRFRNAQVFRNALKEWQVQQGYDLKWVRNENKRITAVCKQECGFRIHASPMQNESTFQIKSLKPLHSCEISAMQKNIHRELMVDVSKSQVYRAKRKAKETIEGDLRKQPIVDENDDEVERPNRQLTPVFKRLYIKLDAQKQGFVQGCRLVVGLDGCFLKGIYGGQLLASIGVDEYNMFPIAIVAVEAECKDSWVWFLTQSIEDIGAGNDIGWTFILDRQKELVHTFTQILPNVEHRYCLRRFYTNFKQKFRGKEFKVLMWKAAKAGTKREFDYHMKKLGELDKENKPNEWLM